MQVSAIKTKLVRANDSLEGLITDSIKFLPEESVLAITSKVVALCEGRVIAKDKITKHDLVKQEAELYLPAAHSRYNLMITIKHHVVAVNAGVDESNVEGDFYLLLPKDAQQSAQQIWQFCRDHYQVKKLGVIITDSRTFPLKLGVLGTSLGYSGFKQLFDQRGEQDLFGRELKMTQIGVAEGLATAATQEMGEGDDAQPLAIISDICHITWQDRPPTKRELAEAKISLEDDVYAPFLTAVEWQKGGKSQG